MFLIDQITLVGAVLLLISILSSKFSSRLGLPVLVLFLVLGMVAGEEGPGGIVFNDVTLAHAIGTIALAVILFDGGLRTPLSAVRSVWKPSFTLATLGVVVTAGITGAAASLLLGVPIELGLLLGSIVGSTDAAAVFLILRSRGLNLRPRLASTLELESGSNDPMAVFLTVILIEVITGKVEPGFDMVLRFLWQMGGGAVIGLLCGRVAVFVINGIRLESAGLYPVLTVTCGFLAYGLGATLGASGFLSVYLAGIILGNHRFVHQRATLLVHDALAWMSQITMFVVLGLLSFPSQLVGVAGEGVLIALVLIVIARPVALLLGLPFGFDLKELSFLALAGPKGAVPIILSTFPLMANVPNAALLFNIVFFVVLVSAISQGWTMGPMAKWLRVQEAERAEPPVALEISALDHVEGEIVDFPVVAGSFAAGRRIRDLALPEGVTVALVARGKDVIPPRGSTVLGAEDHVYIVQRPDVRFLVERAFSPEPALGALPPGLEVPLKGRIRLSEIAQMYDVTLGDDDPSRTIASFVADRLGARLAQDAEFEIDGVRLRARDIVEGSPQTVVLTIGQRRAP